MSDDTSRRIDRLAEEAKKLDDLISTAAKMQKRIVENLRRIARNDKLKKHRNSASESRPRKRKK